MFDKLFSPSIKTEEPTYPNLHEIIINLEKRVEILEQENAELTRRVANIQPVVYNLTSPINNIAQ